ncbi:MAG: uroporphyrinogen decarboxylase family protein [Candidatus Odinarchaeota archaeon]
MKPIERVFTALQHKEPDKVPIFLLMTVQGAIKLDMSFTEYFTSPTGVHVAKGQLKLQEKYGYDCLYPFFYAAKEYEAFGGKAIVKQNGPPESGKPVFSSVEELLAAELPPPESEVMKPVIEAQKLLFDKKGDELPLINAVIAPLSLPIMLLGFEKWIDYVAFQPETAREAAMYLCDYTISLANYLLEHHATALAYFNPLASSDLLRLEDYKQVSLDACKKFYDQVKGPAVYAFAGAKCENLLPVIVNELKAPGVTVSAFDDLTKIKNEWGLKTNLVGNLNNVAMVDWSPESAEEEIKKSIKSGSEGGGFIISDHHGDLPLQVTEEVIVAMMKARDKWGSYDG